MVQTEHPLVTLNRMIRGFQLSQAIHVAAVLGIADLLRDGPRTSEELARATDAHPATLYRLLRALSAVGVFEEAPIRTFTLTPLSERLLTDRSDSIAGWAVLIGQEYFWNAWGNLLLGIKTGENIFPQLHDGMGVGEYREARPELNAVFNAAMTSGSRGVSNMILKAYDFSQFNVIVDVGGSRGALLAAILKANPSARGVNFDQPHVVSDVDLKTVGVADRCELVGGSFFESVPAGGDAYIMKSIIHDWTDDESIEILKVCRKAMSPQAKLLVIELVVGPPNKGRATKFSDLNMLALPGGRERTEEEFAHLFYQAGFHLTQVARSGPDMFCVIEGVPV